MLQEKIVRRLEEIVGKENVQTGQEDRIAYSYDGTPLLEKLPEAVVFPETADQVAAILQLANEERFAVVPRGSGTGLSGGAIPAEHSISLVFTRWNRILELDEENLTVKVQPGVITAQVHQEVEKKGLFYPPDPGSMNVCTIGGNIAENAGGLRGLKYGVTKDYVMGLEVVLPTGEVARFGDKNVKDVAGYNLKDLIIGSEGTLGIVTQALLKLIPRPQSVKTILAYFPHVGNAAQTVSDIIAAHILPATLEFLDQTTIRCVEGFAQIGLPTDIGALLLIEVDGHPAQVEEEAQKIRPICTRNGATEVLVAKDEAEALRLKTARRAAFTALARVKPTTVLEDATVPRSKLAAMVEKVEEVARKYSLTIGTFGHAGDGNLHPTILTDERDKQEMTRAEKALEEIFDFAMQLGGTITGEHGVGLAKRPFFEKWIDPGARAMSERLKRALDPNLVLNPGKVFSLSPHCELPFPDAVRKPEHVF
jgi:glycolate oxidase